MFVQSVINQLTDGGVGKLLLNLTI